MTRYCGNRHATRRKEIAKATLKLANGTVLTIEGTPEEVERLLELHGAGGVVDAPGRDSATRKGAKADVPSVASGKPDLVDIVNLIKNCAEAPAIETQILDRAGRVNRVLLPLYIVYKHLGNSFGLTSREIHKVTRDLGVPVSQPNASTTLSGTASKYVIGDKVRRPRQAVRYKLSRRGATYMKDVLAGDGRE